MGESAQAVNGKLREIYRGMTKKESDKRLALSDARAQLNDLLRSNDFSQMKRLQEKLMMSAQLDGCDPI